jgi:hypothetical protein
LLLGLRGAGADDRQGDWRVTTNKLHEAINFFMDEATRGIGRAQVPAIDNQAAITLAHLDGPPTAIAIIETRPTDALRQASLSYASAGVAVARPSQSDEPWRVEVPTGLYEFRAEFASGRWVAGTEVKYVDPVAKRVILKVDP